MKLKYSIAISVLVIAVAAVIIVCGLLMRPSTHPLIHVNDLDVITPSSTSGTAAGTSQPAARTSMWEDLRTVDADMSCWLVQADTPQEVSEDRVPELRYTVTYLPTSKSAVIVVRRAGTYFLIGGQRIPFTAGMAFQAFGVTKR